MTNFDFASIDVSRFWREGYLMLRGLFTPDEMLELRSKVFESKQHLEQSGTDQPDALGNELLAPYIYNDRLLKVAQRLLEVEHVVYFGDSSFAVVGPSYRPGIDVGGWHRDNSDRSDTTLPDWSGPYGLIRFGLYLQSHRFSSGGLILRRTSHDRLLKGWAAHAADRYLNNGLGDVGVWSMRIQHAGLGRCIRGLPFLGVGPHWQKVLPEFMQAPFSREDRAGFWISYGRDGDHLDRHCEYLLGRTERLKMWKNSHYAPTTLDACMAAGLKVIDMPGRMREALNSGRQVGHHQHHYQMAG